MREVYPVSKLIEKVIESIDYYGYIDELYKGDKRYAQQLAAMEQQVEEVK